MRSRKLNSPKCLLGIQNCAGSRTTLAVVLAMGVLAFSGCQSLSKFGNIFGKPKLVADFAGADDPGRVDSDELLDPLGARNANRLVLEDLAPGQIATTLATRGKKNDEEKANVAFKKGNELYHQALAKMDANPTGNSHQRMFVDAANKFRVAAANWYNSALEQDALFFEGESFFFADHYVQSNRAFESLIARYSGTRYLDKAESRRFAIAQYWLDKSRESNRWVPNIALNDPSRPAINMKTEARRILHRIRVDDPTGKLSDDATMALANAYFEDAEYYDAASTYEDLRTNYPASKHAFHATLFELKSRIQSYYGDSYDAEPLEKADELLKTLVNHFPEQSKEEEEYLRVEAGAVRNLMAQREFSLGQYYEKRGENRAAQMLYERVAKDFDDTNYADQIETRLAELKGKPAEPGQPVPWLVEAFAGQDDTPVITASVQDTIIR